MAGATYGHESELCGSWQGGSGNGSGDVFCNPRCGDAERAGMSKHKKPASHKTPSESALEGVYDGDLVEGLRCGEGVLRWPNGDTYEGEFVDGLREGTGTLIFNNGAR